MYSSPAKSDLLVRHEALFIRSQNDPSAGAFCLVKLLPPARNVSEAAISRIYKVCTEDGTYPRNACNHPTASTDSATIQAATPEAPCTSCFSAAQAITKARLARVKKVLQQDH